MWESPVEEFEGLDLRYPHLNTDEAYLRVKYTGILTNDHPFISQDENCDLCFQHPIPLFCIILTVTATNVRGSFSMTSLTLLL